MKVLDGYIEKTYATVLFELAEQSDMLGEVKDDLNLWTELCSKENDFEKLIISPYFSLEYKQALVLKAFSGKVADLTLNFLIVTIRHNRIRFLPQIIEQFNLLWEQSQGYCSVEVTVAEAIPDAQFQSLANRVSEMLERLVNVRVRVNPDIIGGIIIRYDDKVIDNTVRTRLNSAVETILKRGKGRNINEI